MVITDVTGRIISLDYFQSIYFFICNLFLSGSMPGYQFISLLTFIVFGVISLDRCLTASFPFGGLFAGSIFGYPCRFTFTRTIKGSGDSGRNNFEWFFAKQTINRNFIRTFKCHMAFIRTKSVNSISGISTKNTMAKLTLEIVGSFFSYLTTFLGTKFTMNGHLLFG